jgi:hypothetical protein
VAQVRRPRTALGIAALAVLAGVVMLWILRPEGPDTETTTIPKAPTQAAFFGINANHTYRVGVEGDPELRGRHLDAIANAGIGFVRALAIRLAIEPVPPDELARDFTETDDWVAALAEHGLRWRPVLGTPTPEWDRAQPSCAQKSPPADPAAFASYAGAVAARYGSRGSFWTEHSDLAELPIRDFEIWNEPNHFAFWCPAPDPAAFAELAALAAEAIHRAAPGARVTLGGLAPFQASDPPQRLTPEEFIAPLVAADPSLAGAVDAIGVHVYGPTAAEPIAQLDAYRATLDRAGLGDKPMVVNEAGWYAAGENGSWPAVPEEQRAEYMEQLTGAVVRDRERLGIAAFAPYTWTTPEEDPFDVEDWFGIAEPESGEPYPSAAAYAKVIAAASGVGRDRHGYRPPP